MAGLRRARPPASWLRTPRAALRGGRGARASPSNRGLRSADAVVGDGNGRGSLTTASIVAAIVVLAASVLSRSRRCVPPRLTRRRTRRGPSPSSPRPRPPSTTGRPRSRAGHRLRQSRRMRCPSSSSRARDCPRSQRSPRHVTWGRSPFDASVGRAERCGRPRPSVARRAGRAPRRGGRRTRPGHQSRGRARARARRRRAISAGVSRGRASLRLDHGAPEARASRASATPCRRLPSRVPRRGLRSPRPRGFPGRGRRALTMRPLALVHAHALVPALMLASALATLLATVACSQLEIVGRVMADFGGSRNRGGPPHPRSTAVRSRAGRRSTTARPATPRPSERRRSPR